MAGQMSLFDIAADEEKEELLRSVFLMWESMQRKICWHLKKKSWGFISAGILWKNMRKNGER